MSSTITEEVRSVTVNRVSLREEAVDKGTELKVDRVRANPGETVRWEVGDRLVSVWFPHSGVFVTPLVAIMHRGDVEATIRTDAPEGVYEYAIYDHDEKRFVTCESHPKLEIPKP